MAEPDSTGDGYDNGSEINEEYLVIGANLQCLRNNEFHNCTIRFKREVSGQVQYYVHYANTNRRLDEWVTTDRLRLPRAVETEQSERGIMTRSRKRNINEYDKPEEEKAATPLKNIETIVLGSYCVDTWYHSPYPKQYGECKSLFICQFCLKYMRKYKTLMRHKCPPRPPGQEIYRSDGLSVFEVDGAKNKLYCQNLCLLSKLFLDGKTLVWSVEHFWFYALCETENGESRIVGYFSKERDPDSKNNLACILVLPPYQRKGYGTFMISFSYELSKLEGRIGSPERPLSDLGKYGYYSYWKGAILEVLGQQTTLSIKELSQITAIKEDDIITTLRQLDLVKFFRGKPIVNAEPTLIYTRCREYYPKWNQRRIVDQSAMRWVPPAERLQEGEEEEEEENNVLTASGTPMEGIIVTAASVPPSAVGEAAM